MFSRTVMAVVSLLALSACAKDPNAFPGPPIAHGYNRDTPIETLAADPAAAAVLNKDLPGLLSDSRYSMFKGMSLYAVQQASGGDMSAADLDKTVSDLQALPPR